MIDIEIQDLVPRTSQWNETSPQKNSYEKREKGISILVE